MTDLEWIERKIENTKFKLKNEKDRLLSWNEQDDKLMSSITQTHIEMYKKELTNLQQIKAKLEAWEIVAPDLIEGKLVGLTYFLKNDLEKYETIKNALEVEDE